MYVAFQNQSTPVTPVTPAFRTAGAPGSWMRGAAGRKAVDPRVLAVTWQQRRTHWLAQQGERQ
jgi:hypothetical protein